MTLFFHRSSRSNRESIIANGLVNGAKNNSPGFTNAGTWADEIYGQRPIYLSKQPWGASSPEELADTDVYLVNTSENIRLLPDLPSLIDHGGIIDDEQTGMWWEQGQEPPALLPYLDENGWFDFNNALNGEIPVDAFRQVTGTVATLDNISADSIRLIEINHDLDESSLSDIQPEI